MSRPIHEIERDLAAARADHARNGPTHRAVAACERLYAELQSAKGGLFRSECLAEGPFAGTDDKTIADCKLRFPNFQGNLTTTTGLLGAKVPPLPGQGQIVAAGLEEIERRILAIEARLSTPPTKDDER